MVIAFFDHGLDDVLFHTQRELDRARRDAADKRNTAIALKRDADGLRGQLEAAKVEVAQLKAFCEASAKATAAAQADSLAGAAEIVQLRQELARKEAELASARDAHVAAEEAAGGAV